MTDLAKKIAGMMNENINSSKNKMRVNFDRTLIDPECMRWHDDQYRNAAKVIIASLVLTELQRGETVKFILNYLKEVLITTVSIQSTSTSISANCIASQKNIQMASLIGVIEHEIEMAEDIETSKPIGYIPRKSYK